MSREQVEQWCLECVEFDRCAVDSKISFYKHYARWFMKNGYPLVSQRSFGQFLCQFAGKKIIIKRFTLKSSPYHNRQWCYEGIRLKESS